VITADTLRRALRAVANENAGRASWNYDSLDCLKLAAKAELCAELAAALGLDIGPVNCTACRATNNPEVAGAWRCRCCGGDNST
jgi:transposase-like protein